MSVTMKESGLLYRLTTVKLCILQTKLIRSLEIIPDNPVDPALRIQDGRGRCRIIR